MADWPSWDTLASGSHHGDLQQPSMERMYLRRNAPISVWESTYRHLSTTSSFMYSKHEDEEEESSSSDGFSTATTSGIAIAWYCILLLVSLSLVVGCWWATRRRHQRELAAAEAALQREREGPQDVESPEDLELARMQANVKVFAQKQEGIKKKNLLKAMKDQFVTVTAADLEPHHTRSSGDEPPTQGEREFLFQEGCSICMEAFGVGDVVAHSRTLPPFYASSPCLHLFHQECIVPWFVASSVGTRDPKCPCCRQVFVRGEESPPVPEEEEEPEDPLAPRPTGGEGETSSHCPDTEDEDEEEEIDV